MGIEDIAAKLKPRVESGNFERSVKFDTGGDGVIVIDGNTISTTDGPADCTIKLSLSDFEDLLSGELSPTTAFMTGKLKIEGDMAVAMALQQLL
jgi:putative sterol carrier protein